MARMAIFVDGGYLNRIAMDQFGVRIDYAKIAGAVNEAIRSECQEPLDVLRTYYYDCLPYQSKTPTAEEAERFGNRQSWFAWLDSLPRFTVREGRLKYRGVDQHGRPLYEQKRIGLLLGLDVALLAGKQQVAYVALMAGDADLMPAVRVAQQEGVVVWLFHGPRTSKVDGASTYSMELWKAADERREIDGGLIAQVADKRPPKSPTRV